MHYTICAPWGLMMIVTSPLYSLKAWKAIGEVAISTIYHRTGSTIFRRLGRHTLLEKTYTPTNPQTPSQQSWRGSFAVAVGSWQALTLEEKASWKDYQDNRKRRPVMDGYNLYISKFLLSGGNPQIPPDGRAEAR